jgi:putative proteasome-type protease
VTYCVGMRLQTGIVVIADTRTNAGIDNVSTYKKLHTLADDGERLIVAASAGSLSVTQAMLSILKEGLEPLQDGEPRRFIDQAPSMFRVAELVGEALVIARREVGRTLEGTSINADVSLLLAGAWARKCTSSTSSIPKAIASRHSRTAPMPRLAS